MLRLLGNRKNLVALSESWWRGPDGQARRVGTRLMKNVVAESGDWGADLLECAKARENRNAWTEGENAWMGELVACQNALADCLVRGEGMEDVLDWRRRGLFGAWEDGSDRFWKLTRSLWSVEGRGRDGLALLLDRLAQEDERAAVGTGVEVLGVSGSAGREWRGVCVLNAVRPRDDEEARRRLRDLYVACGRARELVAVCDYEADYLRRPAVSLVGGLGLTENSDR